MSSPHVQRGANPLTVRRIERDRVVALAGLCGLAGVGVPMTTAHLARASLEEIADGRTTEHQRSSHIRRVSGRRPAGWQGQPHRPRGRPAGKRPRRGR
eukprot:7809740-Pyramimonas_sp.AAC.1